MPNDTFSCHNGACKIWVVFLALQSWNSNFCFRGPVAMWELSLGVPTLSSHSPNGESVSGTMLVLSSSTKVAIHMCAGVYIEVRLNSDKQSYGMTALDLSSVLHPTLASTTCPNYMPIFLDWTNCLHVCFRCIYTMVDNKNYQKSSWIMVNHENILTVTILTLSKNTHTANMVSSL